MALFEYHKCIKDSEKKQKKLIFEILDVGNMGSNPPKKILPYGISVLYYTDCSNKYLLPTVYVLILPYTYPNGSEGHSQLMISHITCSLQETSPSKWSCSLLR